MADGYVSVPMTLSDPNPGFNVTVVDCIKNGASYREIVTIEH